MTPSVVLQELRTAQDAAKAHVLRWIYDLAKCHELVRALALQHGVALYAIASGFNNLQPGRVDVNIAQERVNVFIDVPSGRCRAKRVYLYIPFAAFDSEKNFNKWARQATAEAERERLEHVAAFEIRTRTHVRTMASLSKSDRDHVLRRAHQLDRAARKKAEKGGA